MCHFVCNLEWHISLNIVENLFLNETTSRRLNPRSVFCFVTFVPVISSPKGTNLVVALFFPYAFCWGLGLHTSSSSGIEPRIYFCVVVFVFIISSSKREWLYSVRHSSVMLSLQGTGIAITEVRTFSLEFQLQGLMLSKHVRVGRAFVNP